MAVHVFNDLFVYSSGTIVINGPWIHLLDTRTGKILDSKRSKSSNIGAVSYIQYSAYDEASRALATVTNDKQLCTWTVNPGSGLDLISTREIPKTASCILIDSSEASSLGSIRILIGDKFGDVFSYPMEAIESASTPPASNGARTSGRDSLAAHVNKHGTLLLAKHIDGSTGSARQYLITSDRDEHIRVSRYPQTFVVERFCLGSRSFVSGLHILRFPLNGVPNVLVSGGGEDTLRFWDWHAGVCLSTIAIGNIVTPFLKIRPKAQPTETSEIGAEEEPEPAESSLYASAGHISPIAVQHIESFQTAGRNCIVFSVLGASALFQIWAPELGGDGTLPESSMSASRVIATTDFNVPILSFFLARNEDTSESFSDSAIEVYVTLDTTESDQPPDQPLVRRLIPRGSELVEDGDNHQPLIESLNRNCARPLEGERPDHYEMISLLPKSAAEERGYAQAPPTSDDPGRRSGEKRAKRDKVRNALAEQLAGRKDDAPDERSGKKSKLEE